MRFNPFRRKNEVVDLTIMRDRGILKDVSQEKEDEFVDFSSSQNQTAQNSGSFDFLSSLATGADSSLTSESSPGPITESLRDARKRGIGADLNEMRIKLEDTEYKLNNALRRIQELERKTRELERK